MSRKSEGGDIIALAVHPELRRAVCRETLHRFDSCRIISRVLRVSTPAAGEIALSRASTLKIPRKTPERKTKIPAESAVNFNLSKLPPPPRHPR